MSSSSSTQVSRRTLVRGAAWSVPVVSIAAAAPAFAASPCDTRTGQALVWGGPNTTWAPATDRRSGVATFDPDLADPVPAMTLTLTTDYQGNMKPGTETGLGTALDIVPAIGGLAVSGLKLLQATTSASPQGRSDRGSYTFTFSQPVSNLVFTLTDIDSLAGDFDDLLELTPGYAEEARGTRIISDNNGPSSSRRYYNQFASNPLNDVDSGAGNVRVRYAGPISSFTVTYWSLSSSFSQGVDSDQGVFISGMNFDYDPC